MRLIIIQTRSVFQFNWILNDFPSLKLGAFRQKFEVRKRRDETNP